MHYHKKHTIGFLFALAFLFISCSNEDDNTTTGDPFVVAFENLSSNLSEIDDSEDIVLVYSETATQNGLITIAVEIDNATYGEDFTTTPPIENNTITLPINSGENGKTVLFKKLNSSLDETVKISFTIIAIEYPSSQIQGNTTFLLGNTPSLGRGFSPQVGGPNQQNQVYIDLSSEVQTVIQRDHWDLGFYSGNEFRVSINGSIYMAAAQLESTNIDEVTADDVIDLQSQVAVGTFDPANEEYIDHPDGDITKTAITNISTNDAENKVYLINLGYEVGTETPSPGSVAVAGDARGWKKIRILRNGDSYLLQYADLDDNSHQEVIIEKRTDFNFTFFSFNSNSTINVEPQANQWDIYFTVFTNIIQNAGSYGFSDGVLHNRKGGVVAYSVSTDDFEYDSFSLSNVNSGDFQQDQRAIGSSWRDVISDDKVLVDNIFYVIKDPNGNIYKLKFTALLSESGERGYPEFKYRLLQ